MSSPLVSIALCTYNGEKYLAQLLDTLVAQTYKNIEIIAVDDNSSDKSFNILSEYASLYPYFQVYKNDVNLGFTGNFERALTFCKGDLIAFCDQDDLWDPQKIEIQVKAIGDNLVIYHDSEFINEQNQSLHQKMSDLLNFYRGDDPRAFLFFNCVSGHSMLIKKQLLPDAMPFPKGFYYDWWLAYVAVNSGKIDFVPQCLVKYRQHDDSDTDVLKKKEAENDPHRHKEMGQIYNERLKWLRQCAKFKKNKNPEFVYTLYTLYYERVNNYFSPALAILMKKI
ncbi:putative glycosyltransferase EpsH [Mucilaginibacter gotjawali]|uniref:Putative glycosyltransferase EpsH n=1 Tax=Mucilaginibacter gotjawali TaxID=1550579 RepID=A0A0X8XAF8_9SPHI|nr:glycosyltransferase family 2 protein [Mucilaginibacter gotjawali]BAU56274.1 putative glycosyltransferase EpsH [Mucilaginibacter gotjawali]